MANTKPIKWLRNKSGNKFFPVTHLNAVRDENGDSVSQLLAAKYVLPADGIPITDLSSDVQTSLALANTALLSYTETDPTVPSWAKESSKPAYTANEVGALPSSTLYAGSTTVGGTANKTASIPFGKLDSTSTSTVMTAQVEGISELRNGVCMFLMNGVVTSATNFTININGLGAKPVYGTMATATRLTTLFNVNYTGFFVYNEERVSGGCWDFYYGYNSNDNTVGYNVVEYYSGTKRVKTASQRYQVMLTCFDGLLLPVFSGTYTTAATKTLTTEKFNPLGQIYYYNTTTNLAANGAPSNASLYPQAAYTLVDLRYSFNTASTLTAGEDIYLVCKPNIDGSAVLHSEPIAKALPTTEDGLLYKRLGKAYDTYRIILELHKPVYYYKNGAIREWTGVDCFDSISQEETFTFAKADKTSNAVVEAVKGNTVVWNQLCNITFPVTQEKTNTESSMHYYDPGVSFRTFGMYDHKLYERVTYTINSGHSVSGGSYYYNYQAGTNGKGFPTIPIKDIDAGTYTVSEINVYRANSYTATSQSLFLGISPGDTVNVTFNSVTIIDLTLMFGAGNEPSTVEEFEEWLTNNVGLKPYYAYNEGELINVKSTGIKTVGFNQWDEEWEVGGIDTSTGEDIVSNSYLRSKNYINVFSNTSYYCSIPSISTTYFRLFYYSYDKSFIGTGVFKGSSFSETIPDGVGYIRFVAHTSYYGSTYNNDICINISNPSKNGTYEPYWSETKSLPITTMTGKVNGEGSSVVIFPDGMKRAGSVYDEIYTDTSGVTHAIKRIEKVDMGTLTWNRANNNGSWAHYAFYLTDSNKFFNNQKTLIADYIYSSAVLSANAVDKTYRIINSSIYFKDESYTTAADFKAAVDGDYLYYELATPVEYIIDDFTLPVIVKMDEWGTKLMLPENTSTVTTLSPTLSVEYPNKTTVMIEEAVKKTQNMISITYSELKALRDNNKLIAGMQYRITDYVTTTAQENTQSAGHQFDVIVRADSTNVLNEDAYAALHNGDTYFANSKLEAWELKYCLDNDTMRFVWADVTNGKGVIYYMKDEWNNECPYDFKNILFSYDDDVYVYTFSFYYDDSDSSIVDASIKGNDGTLLSDEGLITGVYGNIIKERYYVNDDPIGVPMILNHVVFVSKETFDGYFYGCTMNTIGKDCDSISFADNCHRNMLDSNCVNITLGEGCNDNSFGNNCFVITLVGNNLSNTFGQQCGGIVLNDSSSDNTFMSSCNNIMIGENSLSCVFEHDCKFISFGVGSSLMHNYRNIHIGCNVKYVNIVSSSTTTDSYFLKNIDVAEGLCGSALNNRLTLTFGTNKDYVQRAGRNSSGTVRIYCPDDEPAT